ncbi:MAG: hypothetical protein ACK46L_07070 [Synechococcaceae cyanobacterium]
MTKPPFRRQPERRSLSVPTIMQQWEYQVIHLNVDSPTPTKEGGPPAPEAPPSTPPFTKTYLEQEFPRHYGPQQPPGTPASTSAPQPQHPTVQLQGFMNTHGLQGWELLGIFPLGSLLMMIFRRPLQPQAGPAPQAVHPTGPQIAARAVPTTQHLTDAVSLQAILDRLVALEHRLAKAPPDRGPAPEAPQDPSTTPAVPQERRPRSTGSAWILSEERLRDLSGHPVCSTAQASRSLGFRSPASLLNPAALHGYPIGLVRVGPNGKAAVYQGIAPNQQGGRDVRLWLVLDSQLLPSAPR